MNVVDAYIKFKGQLIILISGLYGTNKTKLAQQLEHDFKIRRLNQFDYFKENFDKKEKILEETEKPIELINWYQDDAIDWDKLNNDVDKSKSKGVVISGLVFPKELIKFKPNFHIHLNISKQTSLEKLKDKLEADEMYENLNEEIVKRIMNKFLYPYYLNSIERSAIGKFIKIKDHDMSKVYDELFDYLIEYIEKYLYEK